MKTKFLIPLIAGVGLFCACKNKTYEVVNNSTTDSVKIDTAITGKPKLVKKGAMRIKVKNVDDASNYITILTNNYHGMVMQHDMEATEERREDMRVSTDSVMRVITLNKNASMTVTIPTENLDEFMNKVAVIGVYVNSRTMDVNNKSLDYLSSQLKLKNRSELVAQQKRGKIIIKDPASVLMLKDDMVDELIGNKKIDEDAKNTTISLNLYQSNTISKEMIANDDPSAYNLPALQRLSMSFQNGWGMFVDLFVALANLWAFILLALGGWALFKFYQTKRSTRIANI